MIAAARVPVGTAALVGSGFPPGPRAPRPLQTAAWAMRPYGTLERSRARFGERFTIEMVGARFIALSNPAHVKEVFTGDPEVFHAGKGNIILLPFMGENSILLLDGARHMAQRRLLLPPLHGDRMRAHVPLMEELAAREVAGWPAGEPLRLAPRMSALTLEVILHVVFGVDDGSPLVDRLRGRLREFINAAASPWRMLRLMWHGPRQVWEQHLFADIFDPVDAVIRELIAERRAAPQIEARDDILSLLLLARHEGGAPMSDTELRDELLTLLIAGHETTATALTWAIERLIRHPHQMAALERSVAGDGDPEYLDAVIRETLRLRPVLPFVVRELQEETVVGGWRYPRGACLTPCIHLVHRDPGLYPEPARFRPERWLSVRPSPYTYFPFGGGVRRCIGSAFAEAEMRAVLRAVVAGVALTPVRPEPERVRRRVITLVPARGGEVIVRPRA